MKGVEMVERPPIPEDKVFFPEMSLGIIAAARSIVLRSEQNQGERLLLLHQASTRVYEGELSMEAAKELLAFTKDQDTVHLDKLKNLWG